MPSFCDVVGVAHCTIPISEHQAFSSMWMKYVSTLDDYMMVLPLYMYVMFLSPLSLPLTPFLHPSLFSHSLPPLLPPFLQTTQSTDLQSLIGWLLDHTNLEVPEVDRPSLPPIPPEPPKPSSEEPSAEGAPELSESSSDSSDYSDDSEEDEPGGMRWSHSHTSSPVIALGFHQSSWHGKRVASFPGSPRT